MKHAFKVTLISSLLLSGAAYGGNSSCNMNPDHCLDPTWAYKKAGHKAFMNHGPQRDLRAHHHGAQNRTHHHRAQKKVAMRHSSHSQKRTQRISYNRPASTSRAAGRDIIDTALLAGQFDTLMTAVIRAGLVKTLKGNGPFTVFAPTDEAFSKIPQDQLNALLKDKEALAKVLTYHVVPGKVLAKDVVKLNSAKTVQGQSIRIDSSSGVMVDNARVVKADIKTSNGVIHVIDSVMLPKDGNSQDIVDTAINSGSFNTLVSAVKKAGLVPALRGDGPFTVFAPTDEAFSKIPKVLLKALVEDKDTLAKVLTYHVVPGKVMAKDVVKLNSAKTLQGQSVSIDSSSGVKVNNAQVVQADIETSNGVIHVIDTVILPM